MQKYVKELLYIINGRTLDFLIRYYEKKIMEVNTYSNFFSQINVLFKYNAKISKPKTVHYLKNITRSYAFLFLLYDVKM